jgi:hypothetical protein
VVPEDFSISLAAFINDELLNHNNEGIAMTNSGMVIDFLIL